MSLITVGSVKEVVEFVNRKGLLKTKKIEWKYTDVPVNKQGWTVDINYRPIPFDVCALLLKDKERPIHGWWTGIEWTALRLRSIHQIVSWKYIKDLN